jgi:DNA-binding transcriptional LysR family regulator
LSGLDLNLLVALDALLREHHVGRAAAAIGRSQPAMSHALSRLRAVFRDPLLTQSGRRMVLSPRARALREPLAELLRNAGALLKTPEFDPASARRTFRVMMPDYVADLLMPALIARTLAEAPGISIEIAEWRGASTLTSAYLETIDLVVSKWLGRFTGFKPTPLFKDIDVIALRAGRRLHRPQADVEAFLQCAHVAVVGPGEVQDPVDSWLAERHLARRIALRVPTYLLALRAVAESDLVAVVPKRLVAKLKRPLGLREVGLPIDPGEDVIHLHTPAAADRDPSALWFHRLVRSTI